MRKQLSHFRQVIHHYYYKTVSPTEEHFAMWMYLVASQLMAQLTDECLHSRLYTQQLLIKECLEQRHDWYEGCSTLYA